MPFMLFILLVVTFGLWFPVVAGFFIIVGGAWMICYPIACTAHWLYMRVWHKKRVPWELLYPNT